jgi:hypothetical protein
MSGSLIVLETIAAEVAQLKSIVRTPVEPFGYGVDSYGSLDVTDNLAEVDAFSPEGIAQALARRLQTPRGTLQDDLDYGRDLRAYLNRGLAVQDLRALEGEVRLEAAKDDRISEVEASVTLPTLSRLSIALKVYPEDPNTGGPFDLILAVTSAEVVVEAIHARA